MAIPPNCLAEKVHSWKTIEVPDGSDIKEDIIKDFDVDIGVDIDVEINADVNVDTAFV
ncbi:hypothetical protein [Streptomyces telluris]|uniref:Uncharacterized protein n=1 Tax=Streptomyces telluris TaxID=2720021 RepID=A0A9X2LHK3_9ACTN|nr:hypothetical protein [Streptomyces telluris]MCQ8770977.1 hypothetical protein [Streptomyces telluris]NJP80906.1 hypothetical protein [Streptomyces telluris]